MKGRGGEGGREGGTLFCLHCTITFDFYFSQGIGKGQRLVSTLCNFVLLILISILSTELLQSTDLMSQKQCCECVKWVWCSSLVAGDAVMLNKRKFTQSRK